MELSIIIVNHNTKDLLLNCLNSIYQTIKKTSFEIIVVDNNSSDNSVTEIKKKFPKLIIIKNKQNLGYGKANNHGAQIASGDFLLFLNSDTVLKPNCIAHFFQNSNFKIKNSTIYGCKLLNQDNSIQPSAGFFPTISRLFIQMLFIDDLPLIKNLAKPYQQNNLAYYQKNQTVDWVTGAFFLLSQNLFQKISGFDESIFMYGEEVDLCFRAKAQKAKVQFLSKPEVFHLKGASSKNAFEAAILGEYKGLITFYQKHFPKNIHKLKTILKVGALLRIILFAIINPSKSKVYQKAYKLV